MFCYHDHLYRAPISLHRALQLQARMNKLDAHCRGSPLTRREKPACFSGFSTSKAFSCANLIHSAKNWCWIKPASLFAEKGIYALLSINSDHKYIRTPLLSLMTIPSRYFYISIDFKHEVKNIMQTCSMHFRNSVVNIDCLWARELRISK